MEENFYSPIIAHSTVTDIINHTIDQIYLNSIQKKVPSFSIFTAFQQFDRVTKTVFNQAKSPTQIQDPDDECLINQPNDAFIRARVKISKQPQQQPQNSVSNIPIISQITKPIRQQSSKKSTIVNSINSQSDTLQLQQKRSNILKENPFTIVDLTEKPTDQEKMMQQLEQQLRLEKRQKNSMQIHLEKKLKESLVQQKQIEDDLLMRSSQFKDKKFTFDFNGTPFLQKQIKPESLYSHTDIQYQINNEPQMRHIDVIKILPTKEYVVSKIQLQVPTPTEQTILRAPTQTQQTQESQNNNEVQIKLDRFKQSILKQKFSRVVKSKSVSQKSKQSDGQSTNNNLIQSKALTQTNHNIFNTTNNDWPNKTLNVQDSVQKHSVLQQSFVTTYKNKSVSLYKRIIDHQADFQLGQLPKRRVLTQQGKRIRNNLKQMKSISKSEIEQL